MCERGLKSPGGVAVSCGVSDPVLGEVAGVGYSAVIRLSDGIENRHTYSRGKVCLCLFGERKIGRHICKNRIDRILYVDGVVLYSEVIDKHSCILDVGLYARRA